MTSVQGATNRTPAETPRRKADHIRINLEEDPKSVVTTGLERYWFVHNALPELDGGAIDTCASFVGKPIRAPILLSCMTGGVSPGARINENLAGAAEALGLPMGVGSQRVAIEDMERAALFRVRHIAPTVPLLANIGAVQLNYGYGLDECHRAVAMIDADALVLHLNPLQEMLQPEGNTDFSGLLGKIEKICRALPLPVIVKEVGWGISEGVAKRLTDAGVAGIDVAGSGGTSWSEVERHRADNARRHRVAESFAPWGIPTADAILMTAKGAPRATLIASGGIRTGIDVAKCIALGADLAGLASPVLKAAAESSATLVEELQAIIDELRTAMFCIGAGKLRDLRSTPALMKH